MFHDFSATNLKNSLNKSKQNQMPNQLGCSKIGYHFLKLGISSEDLQILF
jgi:hypothetical protein